MIKRVLHHDYMSSEKHAQSILTRRLRPCLEKNRTTGRWIFFTFTAHFVCQSTNTTYIHLVKE